MSFGNAGFNRKNILTNELNITILVFVSYNG